MCRPSGPDDEDLQWHRCCHTSARGGDSLGFSMCELLLNWETFFNYIYWFNIIKEQHKINVICETFRPLCTLLYLCARCLLPGFHGTLIIKVISSVKIALVHFLQKSKCFQLTPIAATRHHYLSPLFSIRQKERDLELAARIGQSLLKKNRTLTEQNDYLEERVAQIAEEVCPHTRTHSAQFDKVAQIVWANPEVMLELLK